MHAPVDYSKQYLHALQNDKYWKLCYIEMMGNVAGQS